MNVLRKIKIKYVTGNLIPISDGNRNDYHPNKKTPENENTTKCKTKKVKKSDREIFKDAVDLYVRDKVSKVSKNKSKYKLKNKYDKLAAYTYNYTVADIDKNYFKLSKKIRKAYKLDGYKIKKIDSDTVVLNLIKAYTDFTFSSKSKNTNSLFNIYATYNYMISDINYEYLSDFHININKTINKLRDNYGIKADLRSPIYLSTKVGAGRKKLFKLAFKLVTVSKDITCDMPRKKYLDVCNTKEDFLELYGILGGGILRYMKRYEVSPLFKIFVKAIRKSDILNQMGYNGYNLNTEECLGISAILFAQMILSTYGTKKGTIKMLELQTDLYDKINSLCQMPSL